jgi:cellulose synthase (UDP-forming)
MKQEKALQLEKKQFLVTQVPKPLLAATFVMGLIYFIIITFWFTPGNPVLFALLIAGQLFHLWLLFSFLYTVWETEGHEHFFQDPSFTPPVDIFITVAGEPTEVVLETVQGARAMEYPNFRIYILNDGFVAKKDNWKEIEDLAKSQGIGCITRQISGGAKAGNINNGLKETRSPFVVIFDADHVPHRDFLKKMMPYFADQQVGFVQSPQFYKNYSLNYVTLGAWEQQQIFFGPICKGKNRLNAVTMCGTNMVIRREALEAVGGMDESITEDFTTGMFLHEKGYKSVYVPEVLAEGLAPEDFLSYYKQQFRWARGGFDIIFKHNVLGKKHLSFRQKLQYFASISFYLSGTVIVIYALLPLIFFFTGLVPFKVSTMLLALVFLPYIFLTLYALQRSANSTFTFNSLAFSVSSFSIHVRALFSALFGKKASFSITSKKKLQGNFLFLVWPHILYVALAILGMAIGFWREGLSASMIANMCWTILYMTIFSQFIILAMPERATHKKPNPESLVS